MAGAGRERAAADAGPASQRAWMVERHIAARGIGDDGVLRAMAEVPRERFVPADLARRA
jgi:protein-L-isoaspartate O-methyltransferase